MLISKVRHLYNQIDTCEKLVHRYAPVEELIPHYNDMIKAQHFTFGKKRRQLMGVLKEMDVRIALHIVNETLHYCKENKVYNNGTESYINSPTFQKTFANHKYYVENGFGPDLIEPDKYVDMIFWGKIHAPKFW